MSLRTSSVAAAVAAALASLLAAAGPARADKAVVIGVNRYANLESLAQLDGCVDDAKSVSELLQKYGFQSADVTLLTDTQATREGIQSALQAVGQRIKPGERLVVYFAGHGTRTQGGSILPSDALPSGTDKDISSNDLESWVNGINARSRTVILDSCFSGGMMRSVPKGLNGRGRKTRYYARGSKSSTAAAKGLRGFGSIAEEPVVRATRGVTPRFRSVGKGDLLSGAQSKDLVLEGGGSKPAPGGKKTGDAPSRICYFVAARSNEQAAEDVFDDGAHGVFTHFLTQDMTGGRDLWGAIHEKVQSDVSVHLDDTQHPDLTPSYQDVAVFDGTEGPQPAPDPGPSDLWDVYTSDSIDPSVVQITMDPDQTTYPINKSMKLNVKAGSAGYLVVIERGTSGNINLIWPQGSLDAATAQVNNGGAQFLGNFHGDAVGTERVKAILFKDRNAAQAVLDAFKQSRTLGSGRSGGGTKMSANRLRALLRSKRLRDLVRTGGDERPFYTSDIIWEASNE